MTQKRSSVFNSIIAFSIKDVTINIMIALFLILILPSSYAETSPKNQTKFTPTQSSAKTSKAYSHRHKVMVVLLLVDDETFRFHGRENMELYGLTLMSLVDEAFHHPSLGVIIEIWLRTVHYLTPEQSSKIHFQKDLSKTLNSFCEVAQSVKQKYYYKDRIDAFVLLTRRNFGPSGYAPVGSVCSPGKNCLMVQDKGFSSAYVIAHELGHTLGMNHDGEKNKCRRWGNGIMTERVLSNFYNHFWSICSRNSLAETLVEATCLDESPDSGSVHAKTFKNYTYAYAIKWNHHQQCRQTFGSGFWGCPHILEEHMCQSLSCKNYDSYSGGCVTKDFPALPETVCGSAKWCKDIKCSRITNKREVVEWSGWQAWSPCSRTCGVGFQKRGRNCTKTGNLRHGRKCRGPAEEFRTCNTQACAEISDFRAEQCRELDDNQHHWIPFENKNKSLQCKLSCMSEEAEVEVIKDAKDGTFCSYENLSNRCFEGSCKVLGCNGVVNSKRKEDKCGICGGSNKECIKVLKHVSLKLSANEYHELGVFPKYAKNIMIKERYSQNSTNIIFSLQDTISKKWFNESQNIDGPQKFVANGALFTYTHHYSGKYFKAEGPLTGPLSLMVLSTSTDISVDFQYKFYLPKIIHKLTLKKFSWKFSHWSACSKKCEGGFQYQVFECVHKRKKVSRGNCAHKALPVVHRVCNIQSCSLSYWWSSRPLWTPCSVSCGVGVQISTVQCMGKEMDQIQVVNDKFCDAEAKLTSHRGCYMLPCMAPKRRKKRITQYNKEFNF